MVHQVTFKKHLNGRSQEQPLQEDHASLDGEKALPPKSHAPIRKRRPITHATDAKRRRPAMETRKRVAPLDDILSDGENPFGSCGRPDL